MIVRIWATNMEIHRNGREWQNCLHLSCTCAAAFSPFSRWPGKIDFDLYSYNDCKRISTRVTHNENKHINADIATQWEKELWMEKGSNTSAAAINLIENTYKNIDRKLKTFRIFIDVRKTFDSVDHNNLIRKLKIGFKGNVISCLLIWLIENHSYLCRILTAIKNWLLEEFHKDRFWEQFSLLFM